MTREQLIERRATAAQQMHLATAERDKQQRTVDTWHGVLQDCDFWLAQMPAETAPGKLAIVPDQEQVFGRNTIHEDEMQAAKGA